MSTQSLGEFAQGRDHCSDAFVVTIFRIVDEILALAFVLGADLAVRIVRAAGDVHEISGTRCDHVLHESFAFAATLARRRVHAL